MAVILSQGDKLGDGHYTVLKEIGVGGMGVVYHCRDEMLLRDVAIKMLLPELMKDKSNFEIFKQEARLAAQLEHPNIVTIFDIGVEQRRNNSHHYVVMECLTGGNLANQILEGPMPIEHCLNWMKQLASGLSFAHKRGVVHQDIKADNIFITNEGDLKIGDFGLARLMVGRMHSNAALRGMGTPAYMSPELCRGESQDHRSDIYSLGVLFFEMATGHLPFHARGMIEMAMKHTAAAIPFAGRLNPLVPEMLDKLIRRMMAKSPEERYQKASDVLTIIDDLIFELRVARLGLTQNRSVMRSGPVHPETLSAVPTDTSASAEPKTSKSKIRQTVEPPLVPQTGRPQKARSDVSDSPSQALETSKPVSDSKTESKEPVLTGKMQIPRATAAKFAAEAKAAVAAPAFRLAQHLKWSFKCKGPIGWTSAPVLERDGKVVYISSTDGCVYAIDALSGKQIWSYRTDGPILASPVLFDSNLIVVDTTGQVHALSTQEGKRCWKVATGEKLVSTPSSYKNNVLVPTAKGRLLAMDIHDGRMQWQFKASGAIVCAPQQHADSLLFGTRAGVFHSVAADKGQQVWSYQADDAIVASPATSVDSVYFGTQAGTFYALEADTGRLIWDYPANGPILSKGAVAFTSVVFSSEDRWMYCCEKYDGSLMWKAAIKGRTYASLVAIRGTVICVTREGWLSAYNSRTGELIWQKNSGHHFESAPLISGDTLFIGTVEGDLIAYALETTSVPTKKTA